MSDFEQFLNAMGWVTEPGQVETGDPRPWDGEPIASLPSLSGLLLTSAVTPVKMGGKEYQLLAFGPEGARRGWMTLLRITSQQAESVMFSASMKAGGRAITVTS